MVPGGFSERIESEFQVGEGGSGLCIGPSYYQNLSDKVLSFHSNLSKVLRFLGCSLVIHETTQEGKHGQTIPEATQVYVLYIFFYLVGFRSSQTVLPNGDGSRALRVDQAIPLAARERWRLPAGTLRRCHQWRL